MTQLSIDLLHRTQTPTQAEISSWSQSALDLLSIQVVFVDSPEFFQNG